MIGALVLAGLGLIPGIKVQATLLTETGAIDPVWKTRSKETAATEDTFDFYIIEDNTKGPVTAGGVREDQMLEFLSFTKVMLGQKFRREDTQEEFDILEFEALPGGSKEMYLGKARKIVKTGG